VLFDLQYLCSITKYAINLVPGGFYKLKSAEDDDEYYYNNSSLSALMLMFGNKSFATTMPKGLRFGNGLI